MSVIPPGRGMWEAVRAAQEDTGRTVRLCVILLVRSLPLLIIGLAHVWRW
jgi:hypothetical protein